MIAKIKSGMKFYGAANYNQKKVNAGEAKVLFQTGFLNTDPKTVAQSLQFVSGHRVKKPVFHASISFAKEDRGKLDDEKMVMLAREYLDKMGYGNQPVVIYRHFDTAHPHVHILTTRVDVHTGLKIRDNFEGKRSKEITDKMEIKYGLTISDKEKIVEKDIVTDVRNALKNGRPENIDFLNKALKKEGSAVRAQIAGKGLVFFKVDELGKRNSNAFKSSGFKEFGIDMKQLKGAFQANQADRFYVKNAVQQVLREPGKMTIGQFRNKLNAHQIEPVFREGKKGYLGVHFVYKEHSYKGSDLDRSLSWGKTKKHLDLPTAEEYILKKSLVDSAKSGRAISMYVESDRVRFEAYDPFLDEQLGNMDQSDAINLAKKHNKYQGRLGQSGEGLYTYESIINSLEDDVDEHLRNRRQNRQKKQQQIRQ